jgi:hypothetical protein
MPKRAERPSACFPARTAVIALKKKDQAYKATNYTLVFPADWTKKKLLDYVRAVHIESTVRIVKWEETAGMNDEALLWMTNPRAFSNYKKGILK